MPVVLLAPLLLAVGAAILFLLASPVVRGLFGKVATDTSILGRLFTPMILPIEEAFVALFKRYVMSGVAMLVHWIVGLATNVADFPREVRAFANTVADAFDHMSTVTVHEIVKAFVNPVRTAANAAQAAADDVAHDLSSLAQGIAGRIQRGAEAAVAGIWGTVHSIVNTEVGTAERVMSAYADNVAGHAADIAHGIGEDVRDLTRDLGDLVDPRTAAEVVAGVAGLAGVVSLVHTQVLPLVRDLTECAPKLRATCQVDIAEWLGMVEGLVVIAAMPSLLDLAHAAVDAAGEFTDDIAQLAGLSNALADIPIDPRQWV